MFCWCNFGFGKCMGDSSQSSKSLTKLFTIIIKGLIFVTSDNLVKKGINDVSNTKLHISKVFDAHWAQEFYWVFFKLFQCSKITWNCCSTVLSPSFCNNSLCTVRSHVDPTRHALLNIRRRRSRFDVIIIDGFVCFKTFVILQINYLVYKLKFT